MKSFVFIFLMLTRLAIGQNELKHEVYFETDEFDVPPTEQYRLLLFFSQLEGVDIEKISIYGFADDRGSESYNLTLSQNRANAIKEIFSNNEFDESKITNVDGKGEILIKIVKDLDINKIRGLNRKVEIIVSPYFPPRPIIEPEKKDIQTILKGELKAGDKINLENILFQTGYSNILPESEQTLKDIAEILLTRKEIYFTIQGHVCCTQYSRDAIDRATNLRNLSVARAKFIYNYLARKGVDTKRMKYVGMRRKFPLGGEPKYDRRVEILITYAGDDE